jgi:tetratricopeptide (TPR) repeat protein
MAHGQAERHAGHNEIAPAEPAVTHPKRFSRGTAIGARDPKMKTRVEHRSLLCSLLTDAQIPGPYRPEGQVDSRLMAARKDTEAERKSPPESEADQAARAFALLLAWHMDNGTRPIGPLRRWTAKGLGDACGVSERSVRNWRNGTFLPQIETIERELFGSNPANNAARAQLHAAWADARQRSDEPPRPSTAEITPILAPARCFGRDAEADALIAALTSPGDACLLVLGSAGIGKTTLTRRVATDKAVIARFGARRFFVPLETATDAATLRTAIIQAIGLNPASVSFTAALAVLSARPGLLVLDNLETPWEPDQAAAQEVMLGLAGTAGVSVLVSLRGAAAPASPRWTSRPTHLGALAEPDARRLFLELAPEAESEPAHLAHFLTALAGVPLAVELVASRAAGGGSLAELWGEWQRRGIALAEHPDQVPGRLTSLGRSLDLSWGSHRLREPGRRLFRLLGALPAGMADADRFALLGDDAAEAARQLCVVGLAFQHDGRLDLLPPVRDYARTAQPANAEEAQSWCRHHLKFAGETGARIWRPEGAAALALLVPEIPNIEAALLAAATPALLGAAVAALNGVQRLLSATGAGSLTPVIALGQACRAAGNPGAEAECHHTHGDIAFNRSDHEAARAAFEQALPLYRQVGDVRGEANCIRSLGDIALRRSDHDGARAAYEQALPLYRQVGAVLGEANCIQSLGAIALDRSDHDAARAAFEQALPLYRQVGAVNGEGICFLMLGRLALALQDAAGARTCFLDALAAFQRTHATQNCAIVLEDLARVTTGTERAPHLDAARAAWAEIGRPDLVERLNREFG